MKIMTEGQVCAMFRDTAMHSTSIKDFNVLVDNDKQIVIYTGVYIWDDGTFRDEPQCKCNEDTTECERHSRG